jgi:hypothetical protein
VPLSNLLLPSPPQQPQQQQHPSTSTTAPSWVVYCVDFTAGAVVLVEITAGVDLLAEPFLDRGVRRLAGARAAVVSTATLGEWVEASYSGGGGGGGGVNPLAGGLAWVWNTGRCVARCGSASGGGGGGGGYGTTRHA